MINLEPIPKKIQERLKEKMDILGRNKIVSPNISTSKKVEDGLTHAKMATRSTFLRMTSGQLNPVILMGGKLKDDGTIPGGYEDIYGPRAYKTGGSTDIPKITNPNNPKEILRKAKDAVSAESYTTVNNLKRPTPGVKSVEASFKGGIKANREATISWTCWDWTELDLLMPHFLSHGKTVLVEWGWVYDKATLQNLPNFVKTDTAGNKVISADVYNNYKNKVVDENGDFDLMVGVIKNFEYTTRDDGGFDCQTIITSVGVNLLDKTEPNKGFVDPSTIYNIDVNDSKQLTEKLERGTGEEEDTVQDELIELNTTIAFKAFLNLIDDYLISLSNVKLGASIKHDDYITGYIRNEDKYILDIKRESVTTNFGSAAGGGTTYKWYLNNAWVRWGWFEDNILSKFISLTSKDKGDIVSQFRSVEIILNPDGTEVVETEETGKYESVKIRNSVDLETVDISSYILPGQFYPLEKRVVKKEAQIVGGDFYQPEKEPITLSGDVDLLPLKTEVDNFPDFSTKDEVVDKKGKPIKSKRVNKEGKTVVETPGKFGYLRNMLINTKVIKQAFGAIELPDKIESENLFDGIQRMFNALNEAGGLNFWNFNIVQDDTDHQRVKIIDDSTTAVDFNRPVKDQKTTFNLLGKVRKSGIFYFPVWQHDSIVKRQNISAKVPSSLQIATMYGSNANVVGEFGSSDSSFGAEGVAAGAVSNSEKDKRLDGLNIAIKNRNTRNIGLKSGDSSKPLTKDKGEDIIDFLHKPVVQDKLTKNYDEVESDIEEKIKRKNAADRAEFLDGLYDPSMAPPSTDFLSDDQLFEILDEDNYEGDLDTESKNQIFANLKSFFGRKFKDGGVIKEPFKSFVNTNITRFGNTSNENIPLLIPLELELDIDGIGGIYPGNSFHSTYVPVRYQEHTVFQAKDVNHRLDGAGWTTTISGIMRTTLSQLIINANPKLKRDEIDAIKNYQNGVRKKLKQNKDKELETLGEVEVIKSIVNSNPTTGGVGRNISDKVAGGVYKLYKKFKFGGADTSAPGSDD
jgi:hypothetical protein